MHARGPIYATPRFAPRSATTVREVMVPDPTTVTADDDVSLALQIMLWRGLRHLPVMMHGRLVGVVSTRPEIERRLWRLMMAVEPEWRGEIESSLLTKAMRESSASAGNFILDYPSNVAREKIESLGFKASRELTWMGLKLEKSNLLSEVDGHAT